MAKGAAGKEHEFLMSGKPVSLLEIAESSGDENVWKSFLERHGLHHSVSADRYLRGKLGEYLNAREITIVTGIKGRILRKWRNQGILRAEQLKGRWYYSVRDLVNTIKSADIKDIRS
jgi:hypothetical protein